MQGLREREEKREEVAQDKDDMIASRPSDGLLGLNGSGRTFTSRN